MCSAADACDVQSLDETICNTDLLKDCCVMLRECLLDYDFGLEDSFCDASDLKNAWVDINLPKPLMDFSQFCSA